MAGKEKEEEELAGAFLEVLHLRPSNTRVGAQEEDANQRGGDESRWTLELSHQDHRNGWKDFRTNLGEHRSVWRKLMYRCEV